MKTIIKDAYVSGIDQKTWRKFDFSAEDDIVVDWDLEFTDKNEISIVVHSIEGIIGVYDEDSLMAEEHIEEFDISNIKINWTIDDSFGFGSPPKMTVWIKDIEIYCDMNKKIATNIEIDFISE